MSATLVTKKQLAEQLQVSQRTVTNWIAQGRVPCVRIGHRTLRFDPSDVVNFLKRKSPR
jgi:excisionase family DNA binding protein